MENQPQGLKESVALQSYITRKSTFFGLVNRLVYAPTDSRSTSPAVIMHLFCARN